VINEGLSEIIGAFPVPPARDKRERNDDPGQKSPYRFGGVADE
jgi:hypothetical protein